MNANHTTDSSTRQGDTMTEIAIRDENAVAIADNSEGRQLAPRVQFTASPLVQWAYEAQQAALISASLVKTQFVPASLRTAQDVTAAILAGQELGLQPMASLRSMDVIQGTPALRAHAMRGLIQSHGHKIVLVSATATKVVMKGLRKGDGPDEWQSVEWTIERAAALGLTGKDQWKKQPQTMLVARATGELCRLIAADVLFAMPYATEEIEDPAGLPDGAVATPRVTAAEILHNAAPVALEVATAPSRPADPVADEAAQVDLDAEKDRLWALIEENKPADWDKAKVEKEFTAGAGVPMAQATVEQLEGFLGHIQRLGGAG